MKPRKRSDAQPIQYVKGLSLSDRHFCRKLILEVRNNLTQPVALIACSGGIDSTVLVHATSQGLRVSPGVQSTAVYVNHNLRPDEVAVEAEHVESLARRHLTFHLPPIELQIGYGPGLQERARDARYQALVALAQDLQCCFEDSSTPVNVSILTGHNKSDSVETRLMNYLKGRSSEGIPRVRKLTETIDLRRPLLSFSRVDIERYAKCFGLTWMEDSSNSKDGYTRNKVRHHLIPWIEEHINPGLLKTLGS